MNLRALKISKVVSLQRQTDDFTLEVCWLSEQPDIIPVELLQASFVGDREFVAALLAAACNDLTAIFRRHAAAESVFILALSAGRLIGTFHRLSKWNMILAKK